MLKRVAVSSVTLFALWPLGALGDPVLKASDNGIRVGNIMPYTEELAAFGAIGRAEAAYFQMINERGGINGRTIEFISYDSNSDPATAVDLTRNLVEVENTLLVFGSFGTLGNLAVRKYLNERHIPQLFVASGDKQWANPKEFPWTRGRGPP
jgi:branched-chain amino acid transport system substrate-binding protein